MTVIAVIPTAYLILVMMKVNNNQCDPKSIDNRTYCHIMVCKMSKMVANKAMANPANK